MSHRPAESAPKDLVGSGVECRSCGYRLDGLSRDGKCPECGIAVRETLRPGRLRDAPLEYVARLHAGAGLAFASLIAFGVVQFIQTIVSGGSAGSAQSVASLLDNAIGIGFLSGWWLLAGSDPESPTDDRKLDSRKALRVAILAVGVSLIVTPILQATVIGPGAVNMTTSTTRMGSGDFTLTFPAISSQTPGGAYLSFIVLAYSLASVAAWVLFIFTMLVFMRQLAVRMPDFTLADRVRDLTRAVALLLVLLLASPILGAISGLLVLAPVLLLVALFITYAVHLSRMRAGLRSILG